MNKRVFFVLFWLFFIISRLGLGSGVDYYCFRIPSGQVRLDGKINEPCWLDKPPIFFRHIVDGSKPKMPAVARMVWDNQYLYVAFELACSNIWATCSEREDELGIMRRDSFVKLFLDPDSDGRNYVEFHVNPFNNYYDSYVEHGFNEVVGDTAEKLPIHARGMPAGDWECKGFQSAVSIEGTLNEPGDTDQKWSVEIALPWAALKDLTKGPCPPSPGTVWGGHLGWVFRENPSAPRVYWTWPVMGQVNCHLPKRYGRIKFIDQDYYGEGVWRSAWANLGSMSQELIPAAKELGFSALILSGSPQKVQEFASQASASGIETYYWFSLSQAEEKLPKEKIREYYQVMSAEEEKIFQAQEKEKPASYQWGGEPLEGQKEVFANRLLCFHRYEVRKACKEKLKEILDLCPDISGVAFDFFGYQNYRGCYCPVSQALFDYYRKTSARIKKEQKEPELFHEFSLTLLVDFTNEMANYLRDLRPDIKIVIHTYPVFLPEPLYGNRLDVDYCCQTVAWFFEPFWNIAKVEDYARRIIQEEKKFFRRPIGIPFVGLYVNRATGHKGVDRFREELQAIKRTGTSNISLYNFHDLIRNPEYKKVFQESFLSVGRIDGR